MEPVAGGPLADRMRPGTLDEFVGQQHLVGPGRILRKTIESGTLQSLILWGPPGTGKTTLARIIANAAGGRFLPFSAVLSGIKEVREVMLEAERQRWRKGTRTILFIDEIHRFNRAQQDAFLPHVEKGDIILVGATTENPSFEINAALLSRSIVVRLEPLAVEDIVVLLQRALSDRLRGLGTRQLVAAEGVFNKIAGFASGDARRALTVLEAASANTQIRPDGNAEITIQSVEDATQRRTILYDKEGEEHYNLISALHKSVRESDPDAAAYWCQRMIECGEDELFIARRLVRMAVEDIGLADPAATAVALHARETFDFLGAPEGHLALIQAAIYLALAPKSNATYVAQNEIREDLQNIVADPVPKPLRNAPTQLMNDEGYGAGYKYSHDYEGGVAGMECLPERLKGKAYYRPTDRGFEKKLRDRIAEINQLRKRNNPK